MFPLKDDNPRNSLPIATTFIIVLNGIVFLYQLSLEEGAGLFIQEMGLIPYKFAHYDQIYTISSSFPILLTPFSSMFIHGGFFHLISNMWYLWIFGNNVEDSMGHGRFILFYLLTGLLAVFSQVLADTYSRMPMIGASGAIAGILGAYLILFPRAKILTLFFFFYFIQIIKIPAMILLGLWFFLQLLSSGQGEGVAWYAHIGGFISGIIFSKVFAKGKEVRDGD